MAELLFKKGLHANLAAAAKKAGTLYVTTDEKCLYLDVSDTERIRLQGSVLYYSTLEEFYKNEQPPYSTDVIYFIEKDSEGNQFNALMRWNAATSEWIQLNATASNVAKAIDELQKQITANANTLTAHGTSLEGIMNRLSTVEGYVGVPAVKNEETGEITTAATGLHARMDVAESDIDAIETAIGDDDTANSIKGRIKAVEDAIGTDTTENSVKYRITAVEGRLDDMDEVIEDYSDRIADLEKDATDNPKALQSDFKALYDQVNTGDDSIVKQIASNDAEILALQNNSATKEALKNVSDALSEHIAKAATDEEVEGIRSGLQEQIDDINAELGDPSVEGKPAADGTVWAAIEANVAEIAAINEALGNGDGTNSITGRLDAVEDDVEALEGVVEGVVADIGIPETPDYDEGVSNLYDQVAKNKEAIANHETRVGDLETAVGDANSGLVKKAEDNRLATVKNAEDIGKNATAIGALEDALEKHATDAANTYATKAEVAEIEEDLNDKILAANAMRYKGTVATAEALPTIANNDISVGDTYVAAGEFELNGTKVHVGDLLIAKGVEGTDGFIMSDLAWDIVDTGYIESHENKLALEETSDNVSANIKLQGYAGNDLSAVAIKSTCSNITVNVANDALEIGLQWAEF